MQKIAVLGSTGSIGKSTLEVITHFPDRFKVALLSTYSNVELITRQAERFRPQAIGVVGKTGDIHKHRLGKTRVYRGEEGLCKMLRDIRVDTVVIGIVGSAALLPILTALDNARKIAIANKEALVMAGDIIMEKAKDRDVKLLPVDSEHSAIFQCIEARNDAEIRNIYLTGSGGPLLKIPRKNFKNITPRRAINHPKWKMGEKISVDSATLMNKGLEVIEAHHLFGVDIDRIKVLMHPEAVVHSMVEFVDGTILAQLAACDMRIPIQYALTYPSRVSSPMKGISFEKQSSLNFYTPDFVRFPCLRIAYEAARLGDTYPCVLNASNEVAVREFLKGNIKFTDIPKVVEKVLGLHNRIKKPVLRDVLEVDRWARCRTEELLRRNKGPKSKRIKNVICN